MSKTITIIQNGYECDENHSSIEYVKFDLSFEKYEEIKSMVELIKKSDNSISSLKLNGLRGSEWFSNSDEVVDTELIKVEVYQTEDFTLVGFLQESNTGISSSDISFRLLDEAFENSDKVLDLRD